MPIDVVYTWVDDRDPEWRRHYDRALQRLGRGELNREATDPARFRSRDELRYTLRSLAAYAPFVRNVYVVTSGQVPEWLDTTADNLHVIRHEDILDADCLPTFNSHAIESRLHHIPGLAEHYLYLNDDFFFGRPTAASTFFTPDGHPRFFPDHQAMVPDGPCSPADRAVDSASKNTRDLMEAEFGLMVKYKMQHVPYPQRRSLLFEMEERFPLVFKQTARNQLRHHTDLNIPSCLSHYYGFATGAAHPGRISASYINIGNPWAPLTMRRLLQRHDRDTFCLNDGPMSDRRRAVVATNLTDFLEAYFPTPSPFEADQGHSRQKLAMSVNP
ncbi:MAG: stealth family protein [Nitriliruptoraceae bacterium]